MCVGKVAEHHEVARSGQEAQTDDLADAGGFVIVFHGLDAPSKVLDDRSHDSVGGVVNGVGHHLDFLVHLAREDDGIQRL